MIKKYSLVVYSFSDLFAHYYSEQLNSTPNECFSDIPTDLSKTLVWVNEPYRVGHKRYGGYSIARRGYNLIENTRHYKLFYARSVLVN